jgi:hypothetical protein
MVHAFSIFEGLFHVLVQACCVFYGLEVILFPGTVVVLFPAYYYLMFTHVPVSWFAPCFLCGSRICCVLVEVVLFLVHASWW